MQDLVDHEAERLPALREVDREGPVAASGTTTLSDPDAPAGTAIYRVAVSMDSP